MTAGSEEVGGDLSGAGGLEHGDGGRRVPEMLHDERSYHRPRKAAKPAPDRRNGKGWGASGREDGGQRGETGLDVLEFAWVAPMALGREVENV